MATKTSPPLALCRLREFLLKKSREDSDSTPDVSITAKSGDSGIPNRNTEPSASLAISMTPSTGSMRRQKKKVPTPRRTSLLLFAVGEVMAVHS